MWYQSTLVFMNTRMNLAVPVRYTSASHFTMLNIILYIRHSIILTIVWIISIVLSCMYFYIPSTIIFYAIRGFLYPHYTGSYRITTAVAIVRTVLSEDKLC